MTVREYITDKLRAFGIGDSVFIDMYTATDIYPDSDVGETDPTQLGLALIAVLEDVILAPRQNSINEGGFSVSWDFDHIGKYYKWLCSKWGKNPNAEVLGMLGISTIIDKTNTW